MNLITHTGRRELAHRTSDGLEVTLLWTKPTDTVTLEIVDFRSGERLEVEVAKHAALDAFNHPYVYAANRTPVSEPVNTTTE
jgi:hypothetical protein